MPEPHPLADQLVERYPYESVNYNLLANAYRELDDTDAALAVLQKRDGLEFEFLRSQLASVSEGVYSVEGQVMNKSAAAGREITVPVRLLDEEGKVVMTEELMLTLPAAGEATSFLLQFQIDESVAGFQYGQGASASDS